MLGVSNRVFDALDVRWTLTAGEFFDSKVVLKDVEEACHKKKVWPYIVASPHLGFMSLACKWSTQIQWDIGRFPAAI